jgi:Ran GTPase-activating protein (RanGAP) involved in mRNA processing and transport
LDLTGLDFLLLSDDSKITELDVQRSPGGLPVTDLTPVLRVLARHHTLTKLVLRGVRLGHDNARLLGMALCNTPSLQSLVLTYGTLGNAELAGLAPLLYHNTSIKVLDLSGNNLDVVESADVVLQDVIRTNKTITTLNLSGNAFGQTAGAVNCIAEGLSSNPTILKIDLSRCYLIDGDVTTLARNLGSRNTTLQKLTLANNFIASTGVGVLLETTE